MNDNIQIDESRQEVIPDAKERLITAAVAIFLGFVLVQLIGFWLFPGVGIGGLYIISYTHSMVGFMSDLTNLVVITFLAICGVFGWFHGNSFIYRLKNYISYWKFW